MEVEMAGEDMRAVVLDTDMVRQGLPVSGSNRSTSAEAGA
jgi:hypothetical protein